MSKNVLEALDQKDVSKVFPSVYARKHTVLIMKKPKTSSSVRRIYLPKTLAELLIKKKQEIEELKELLGSEYTDHNLVFAGTSGRPIEGQTINRSLKELIRKDNLPDVVFRSLKHSSETYKLKLNGGDIKSVQGDSGHAQINMVTDVYSHIIDEDRKYNAQKFEEAFYKKDEEETNNKSGKDDLLKLLDNPSVVAVLKGMVASGAI